MNIATSELNKGIVITKVGLDETINKYKALHSNACYRLYKNYYLSSPSVFNMYEFVKAFRQEFGEYFNLFISDLDAKVDWSVKRCEYAIAVAKKKGYPVEFIELLYTLKDIFYARESLEALNSLKSRCKLNQKGRYTDTVTPRLSVSTRLQDASLYKCDNEAVSETFQRAIDSQLVRISTKAVKLQCALEALEIPQERIEEIKKSGKAFFSSCLSQDEEIEFLDYFLSGAIKADGVLAEELTNRLLQDNEYHVSSRGNITTVVPFIEQIFVKAINPRKEITIAKREELQSKYKSVRSFFVTDDELVFEVSDKEFEFRTDTFRIPKVVGGNFVMDYTTGGSYPLYNMFAGNVGEFISEGDILENKFYTEVKPIKMKFITKTSRGLKVSYSSVYNISDVYYSSERNANGELITKTLDSKYNENNIVVSEILSSLVCRNSADSLYYEIRQMITTSLNVDENIVDCYLDLVADLVCALAIMLVKGEFYVMRNTGYDYITEDLYNMACYEANEIVSAL